MNRSQTRKLWQRVADGDFDTEVMEWLQKVAKQVVTVDEMPDAVRPGEMLRAVGLCGSKDKYGLLRYKLEVLDEFPFHKVTPRNQTPEERAPKHGERMKNLMKAARESGLLLDDPANHELRKRIERMLGSAR